MIDPCGNGLHDLADPKNVRSDRRGVRICKPCDTAYQKAKKLSGIVSYLPPETPGIMKDYKEPLRAVAGGFGYYGTVTYDESQCFTQCHDCGNFYRHLGRHVVQAHEITSDEYKEKYGLEKKNSLLATNTRTNHLEKWMSMTDAERKVVTDRLRDQAANRSGKRFERRLEWHNQRGTCPDQIIDKILKLQKESGRTPTQRGFSAKYGVKFRKAADVHFGTWREACVQAGLTPNERYRGKRRYSDDQLLESLRSFKQTYGREPYSSDSRTGVLLATEWTYRRRFGTWQKAKAAAFEGITQ